MISQEKFRKNLTAEEFREILKEENLKFNRPPEELLLNDEQLCQLLDVSARLTAEWRSKKLITFSKIGAKIFYKYSDVLKLIEKNKIEAISEKRRI